eukprot:1321902-Pyramimonas_sp.AAC.1
MKQEVPPRGPREAPKRHRRGLKRLLRSTYGTARGLPRAGKRPKDAVSNLFEFRTTPLGSGWAGGKGYAKHEKYGT